MKIENLKKIAAAGLVILLTGCSAKHSRQSHLHENVDWPLEAPKAQQYQDMMSFQVSSLSGDAETSLKHLKKAEKKDPNSDYIQTNLAVLYLKRGNLEAAQGHLKRALAINPENTHALRIHARLLTMSGELEEATQSYEQLVKLDGFSELQDVISLSTLYVEQKNFAAARQVIESHEKKQGKSSITRFYMGRVFAEENQIEDAKKAYRESLDLESGYEPSIKALALIYEYEGESDKAIEAFEGLLDSDPESVQVRMHLVNLYSEQNNLSKASFHLDKILEQDPENAQAWLKKGVLAYESKNDEAAQEAFAQLKKHHSDKSLGAYYLGLILYKQKKLAEADQEFAALVKGHQLYLDAVVLRSQIMHDKGEYSASEKLILKVLEDDSLAANDRQKLVLSLVLALNKQKKYKAVETFLKQELKLDKRNADYWFILGENYDKLNNFKALEEAMTTAIDINPDQVDALNYLGYTYLERGIHMDKAQTYIERAHSIAPENPFIMDSVGWLHYKRKNYAKALEYLKKAHELKPEEAIIVEHIADTHLALGQRKKAKNFYQKCLQLKLTDEEKKRIEKKLQNI